MHFLADGLPHPFAPLRGAVRVFPDMIQPVLPFQLDDHPPGDQLHIAVGAAEVQILAGIHDRRARASDMHLLRAVFIQEIHRLPQLRSPDDGIVDEQQLLPLNQGVHGNLLHLRNLVPVLLGRRHEGAAPGRRILDERPGEGPSAPVRIADGVRRTAVGHPAHVVDVLRAPRGQIRLRHDRAVLVPHFLHVDPFIGGGGITVITPQEGADLLFLQGRAQLDAAVRRNLHDFPAAQLPLVLVSQLLIGKGFEGHRVSVLAPSDLHRQAARPVPGGDQAAVILQDQDGRRTLDGFLGEADSLGEIAFLVDQGRQQLRLVDASPGHGIEMPAAEGQILVDQRIRILNHAGHADGVGAQAGADQQRLGIRVRNAAHGRGAPHFLKDMLKLRPEGCVLNVVNLPLQPDLRIPGRHSGPLGAQMGMIIHAEKGIQHAVPRGSNAKESAHRISPC